MRYAVAIHARQQDELGYRFYISEVFRLQTQGKAWGINYLEFRDYEPPEEKPAEEIVAQVVASTGITLKGRP